MNLLEISIVTRNEKVIGDLINDTEISGSLSIGERIIKLFLLMVDSIIKGENYNKSDLDISLHDKSKSTLTWNFDQIEKVIDNEIPEVYFEMKNKIIERQSRK